MTYAQIMLVPAGGNSLLGELVGKSGMIVATVTNIDGTYLSDVIRLNQASICRLSVRDYISSVGRSVHAEVMFTGDGNTVVCAKLHVQIRNALALSIMLGSISNRG